jgi:alpha-galactosidase
MIRQLIRLGILAAATAVPMVSNAQNAPPRSRAAKDGLAMTPPMGWNPWNTFGEGPQNEKLIREMVDALVASGMKDAGYVYIGPDEGTTFSRDSRSGKLQANLARYPSGLRGLGDVVHKRGLKYFLYTDAGTRGCSGSMPGTKDHEFEDMASFAEWRADYIKIDWCNVTGQDSAQTYTKLHEAQRAAGRPLVHSICSVFQGSAPWKWAAPVAHLWRTDYDIVLPPGKANWAKAMHVVATNEPLYPWAGPGHWNDPDIMIVGMRGLSLPQNRSFFSLWCMMAAPLLAGNDLRNMTPSTIQVLTNPEAIAINQDPLGQQGHIVRREGKVAVWAAKPLFDGSQAVLVFNQGAAPATVAIRLADLGIAAQGAFYVRDLWQHVTSKAAVGQDGSFATVVEPNDVRFLRVSRAEDFPLPPIIVADTYLLSLRASAEPLQKLTGTVTLTNKGSAELPLWKIGGGLPPWLSVRVAKDGHTQTLTNTASAAGLKKGLYHAVVRLDNIEPVSGKPMSAVYYDVDLDVVDHAAFAR